MKKFTSLIMVLLLMLTFAGCGKDSKDKSKEEDVNVETISEKDKESVKGGESIPAPTGVRTDTTEENPAEIGEWVETKTFNPHSDEYEVVNYRITSIERNNDKLNALLEEVNSGVYSYEAPPLEDDKLEYCMVTYDIYFPEEYTSEGNDIVSLDLDFKVKPDKDGYTGYSKVYDFSIKWFDLEEGIKPGQVFNGGRGLCIIPKDFETFIIEEEAYLETDSTQSFVRAK